MNSPLVVVDSIDSGEETDWHTAHDTPVEERIVAVVDNKPPLLVSKGTVAADIVRTGGDLDDVDADVDDDSSNTGRNEQQLPVADVADIAHIVAGSFAVGDVEVDWKQMDSR